MNKKRLLRLAEHLKTVPFKKFNLEKWKCGTVACAVGHAASLPEFKEAGFSLQKAAWATQPSPTFKGVRGWDAVTKFFDIEHPIALHLFYHESYGPNVTAAEVALRIEKTVKEAI